MKSLLIISLSGLSILPLSENRMNEIPCINKEKVAKASLNLQDEAAMGRMRAIEFKSQDYCRAEAPDFEFEVQFKVQSATVYFTGANFKGVEKGVINSNSLKPIKDLMNRCIPGSVVIFDDVKVIGPDKIERTIPGTSFRLF